jgi:hypothetical protein
MDIPITYNRAPFQQSRQYDSFHMIAAVLGEEPRFFFRFQPRCQRPDDLPHRTLGRFGR